MKTHEDNEDGFFYSVQISSDIMPRQTIFDMLKSMSGFKDDSKNVWSGKGLNHHRTYIYSNETKRSEKGSEKGSEKQRSEKAQPKKLWKEHKNMCKR